MTVRSRRSLILPNAIRRSMAYLRSNGVQVIPGASTASGGYYRAPVLDALTYDPNTYEMLGVKSGIGGLTIARGSERYAADYNGVYQLVSANEPAWNGGRYVQNEATYSEDLTNAAWVKTNGTATASIFTATSGNATCLQTLTKAASDRIYACTIGRVTGAGTVEITTDGGTTWVDITSSVAATAKRFTCSKSAEVNPQYGVRLVTSGDEVSFTYHQNEDATGRADITLPSEYCPTDTVGAGDPSGYKVFASKNNYSVVDNVVVVSGLLTNPEFTNLSVPSTLGLVDGVPNVDWDPPTPAVTYYVETTGNDGNDGLSLGAALRTVKQALELAEGVGSNWSTIQINIGAGRWFRNQIETSDGRTPYRRGISLIGAGKYTTQLTYAEDPSGVSWSDEGNGTYTATVSGATGVVDMATLDAHSNYTALQTKATAAEVIATEGTFYNDGGDLTIHPFRGAPDTDVLVITSGILQAYRSPEVFLSDASIVGMLIRVYPSEVGTASRLRHTAINTVFGYGSGDAIVVAARSLPAGGVPGLAYFKNTDVAYAGTDGFNYSDELFAVEYDCISYKAGYLTPTSSQGSTGHGSTCILRSQSTYLDSPVDIADTDITISWNYECTIGSLDAITTWLDSCTLAVITGGSIAYHYNTTLAGPEPTVWIPYSRDSGMLTEIPWFSGNPAATNVLLNSNVVGSQGVALAVGTWSVVVHVNAGDNASAIVTSGTATATGYGTATPGSPIELDVTVEGTVNVEITGAPFAVNLLNLPQAQAKGIAPIPTEGTEVSVQGDGPSFDIANHNNARGAYYFEWKPSYANRAHAANQGLLATRDSPASLLYDSTTDGQVSSSDGSKVAVKVASWAAGQSLKCGVIYDAVEAKMRVCVEGEWGVENDYDGAYVLGTVLNLFYDQFYSNGMRNLQRYDLPYDAAKAKIDELMA